MREAMARLGQALLQGHKREVICIVIDALQKQDIGDVIRNDPGHRLGLWIGASQIVQKDARPGAGKLYVPCGKAQRVGPGPFNEQQSGAERRDSN